MDIETMKRLDMETAMDEEMKETLKTEYHQVQMNKLYDSVIKDFLSEINYSSTNSAIANKVVVMIRNGLTNEEMADKIMLPDEHIDWSPWFTDGYPYKLNIVADYYRWREYYKERGILINPYTGRVQD